MKKAGGTGHQAYLAVGANLGDRVAACRNGAAMLAAGPEIRMAAHSRYYYTAPVDYEDQPWFVNAVFCVRTDLDPVSLLARLKAVEAAAGREKGGVRFGPRVLDLDLVFYDDAVIETPELIVPHPRMQRRAFVLRPLCDIAADRVHPVLGVRVRDLLEDVDVARQPCFPMDAEVFEKSAFA